jgi:hypothetical protein
MKGFRELLTQAWKSTGEPITAKIKNKRIPGPLFPAVFLPHIESPLGARNPGEIIKSVTYYDDTGSYSPELKKIGTDGPIPIAHAELIPSFPPYSSHISKVPLEPGTQEK